MATILIVDDVPANRKVLVAMLGGHGHGTLEASDGGEALAVARAQRPDLIITDVLMPVMDGYELFRQLRLEPITRAIPVVFNTAHYGEREARTLALSSGVAYVMTKPARSNAVLDIVSRALAGQSEPAAPQVIPPLDDTYDHAHLRLLTDKLSSKTADLRAANARLRAVINIGLELSSLRDSEQLLQNVCIAARDLFGASYVTLGLLAADGTVVHSLLCGGAEDDCGVLPGTWISSGDPVPGVLRTVILDRRVLRGENSGGDPTRLALPARHPEVHAFLAAPISSSLRVYGWICLVDNDGKTYTEEDEGLLQALSGQVGRIYELEHEVLERNAVERALQHERDWSQRYLDTAEIILVALDTNRRITMVNRYACAALGWSLQDLLGRDWVETCVPMGMRHLLANKFNEMLSGNLATFESPILTRSGEERLFEWRNTLLRDDEGQVVGTVSSGADIAERRRAEDELRRVATLSAQAEKEFRDLFASNPLPMWIYDLTTLRFCEVNDAAIARYGYTRDAFLEMTIKDIRPPEDVGRLLEEVGQTREPWQDAGSWRHRLRSGEIIDVGITSHTITYKGESAALVVAQDITERKLAETAILQLAALSALGAAVGLALATAESLPLALQQCTDAMVTHLGAALARIWTLEESDTHLKLEASAGMPLPTPDPHGSLVLGDSALGRIARDRKPLLTNTLIGDPQGGDQEWVAREGVSAFAGYPLIVNDRVLGVVAIFSRKAMSEAALRKLGSVADHIALGIARHRGAEALRVTEERMRFALDAAAVGIWDMDYVHGGQVWSEVLEAQYGLAPGKFSGTFEHFVELIHPEDREATLATIAKAVSTGADFSVEHRNLRPDGVVRWLREQGRVQLDEEGKPLRAVGISMDITENRNLEQQYQQAQKMEAIGRLAGGVAHDFNNLLTGILGYCELLLTDLDAKDPHRSDIAEIQKAGLSAASLTRQLLAFSRKQIIEPTRLDLNAVVDGMRAMLGRLIGEDVKIVLDLGAQLAAVRADRGQVEQIIMNLAVNARDAMPNGGTLTVATADVELDVDYATTHLAVIPGFYVVLTVTDTGSGMSAEVQARLFEPFFTTKEMGKGTGLGLATVHGIVKQSGGSINVYSEVGHGTTFKVYFPRDAGSPEVSSAPAPARTPNAQRHGKDETVLVVEDAVGLRQLTQRLLDRQGYTVVVAADAAEAEVLFAQHPAVAVLLTDVVMPGISGPELARRLLARRPGLKVVYMSGYTEDAIVQHGVLLPGIAFLHKPFTSELLGRKIREVLDQAITA